MQETQMPLWAKSALRIIGALNLLLSVEGFYVVGRTVYRVLPAPQRAGEPYFRAAFCAMTIVNLAFLIVLLMTALQFFRLRKSAIKPYCIAVAALLFYELLETGFWAFAHGDLVRSVAGATGIGNMGVSLFEFVGIVPFDYPLATAFTVWLVDKRERRREQQLSTA